MVWGEFLLLASSFLLFDGLVLQIHLLLALIHFLLLLSSDVLVLLIKRDRIDSRSPVVLVTANVMILSVRR